MKLKILTHNYFCRILFSDKVKPTPLFTKTGCLRNFCKVTSTDRTLQSCNLAGEIALSSKKVQLLQDKEMTYVI